MYHRYNTSCKEKWIVFSLVVCRNMAFVASWANWGSEIDGFSSSSQGFILFRKQNMPGSVCGLGACSYIWNIGWTKQLELNLASVWHWTHLENTGVFQQLLQSVNTDFILCKLSAWGMTGGCFLNIYSQCSYFIVLFGESVAMLHATLLFCIKC